MAYVTVRIDNFAIVAPDTYRHPRDLRWVLVPRAVALATVHACFDWFGVRHAKRTLLTHQNGRPDPGVTSQAPARIDLRAFWGI